MQTRKGGKQKGVTMDCKSMLIHIMFGVNIRTFGIKMYNAYYCISSVLE